MTVTHGTSSPEPPAPQGPYDTEGQARADPAVRAVYEAMRASSRQGVMQDGGESMILAACDRADVTPGKYDAAIVRWLAGFEPQACAVVSGLIARAHAAGAAGKQDGGTGRCAQCGGPITPYTDWYDGETTRWRHAGIPDAVAEFLDAEHGAEPRRDGAR